MNRKSLGIEILHYFSTLRIWIGPHNGKDLPGNQNNLSPSIRCTEMIKDLALHHCSLTMWNTKSEGNTDLV